MSTYVSLLAQTSTAEEVSTALDYIYLQEQQAWVDESSEDSDYEY